MKLVCIGDTHNKHRELLLPEGDVLIHTGDCTDAGTWRETRDFLSWYSEQPHPNKILIAGNHDYYFEGKSEKEIADFLPENIQYLYRSGTELEGIKFWGSPHTPGSGRWAFQYPRGSSQHHWEEIPENTDVLLTHSPPYGIMDRLPDKTQIGCEALRKRVDQIRPKLHLFGHIHDSYGQERMQETRFYNCSNLDEKLRCIHPPLSIEL